MTREEMVAEIEAIAAQPDYHGNAGYQYDASRLVSVLPDKAFDPANPLLRMSVRRGVYGSDTITLSWWTEVKDVSNEHILSFRSTGYSGFQVNIDPPVPSLVWQHGFDANRLQLGQVDTKNLIDRLFNAFFDESS